MCTLVIKLYGVVLELKLLWTGTKMKKKVFSDYANKTPLDIREFPKVEINKSVTAIK